MKNYKLISIFRIASVCLFVGALNIATCASTKANNNLKKVEDVAKAAKNKVQGALSNVSKEDVKAKFHEAADALSEEKVNETVDEIADYFDKDKIKAGVDEIANYFDQDKIKSFIDFAAENLDRDKIKNLIDLLADTFDREKIKDVLGQFVASIDKEKVKETFDDSVDKVAATFNEVTQDLEGELKQLGNNPNVIQQALRKHNYEKWFSHAVSYGPATLSHLKLGSSGKAVAIVKPGETVEGEVECAFDRKQCSPLSLYRVVLGIKDRGGQTTVFNHFGLRAGHETDHFSLKAPREKGVYQVGFKVVEAAREGTAIQAWDDSNEYNDREPAVIGLLIVS
jgi:hypothetical protein